MILMKFLDMFSDYKPAKEDREKLDSLFIRSAEIDYPHGKISVTLESWEYVSRRYLLEIAREVEFVYGLRELDLRLMLTAEQLRLMEPAEWMLLFVTEHPMCIGTLAGARWDWEEDTLVIRLVANGKSLVEQCIPGVLRRLKEICPEADVNIRVESSNNLEGKALFDEMERLRQAMISGNPAAAPAKKVVSAPAAPAPSETFYGKPFKSQTIPMKDLNLDMGIVTVEGRVFAVEHKELKKRNAWVISFDMTDNTGSVRVNRFMEANEAKAVLEMCP